jgi:hypothetical protein
MKNATRFLAATILMLATALFAGCEKNEDLGNVGDWVDLGLPSGLLWAERNVGATLTEDYGHYFAWGETQPKDVYDWSTYRYCNGGSDQLTMYCGNSEYGYEGFTDNLTILQPGDDAATANWGDGARTPTKEEWEELISHTTVQWTTRKGVEGRLLTGSNGNKLFLPASGYYRNGSLRGTGIRGYYWSSSLLTDNPGKACNFFFNSDDQRMADNDRYNGYSVRAVRQK